MVIYLGTKQKNTTTPGNMAYSKAWLGMMVVHDLLIRPYFFWGWHWGVTLKLPWWTYSANLFRGIRFPSSYSLPFVEGKLFDKGTKILEVICPHSRPLLVWPCHCLSCSKGLSISIRMWFAKDGSCTKAPVIESFRSPRCLARFQGTRKKRWGRKGIFAFQASIFGCKLLVSGRVRTPSSHGSAVDLEVEGWWVGNLSEKNLENDDPGWPLYRWKNW